MIEINQVVVEAVLARSRDTKRALARGTYYYDPSDPDGTMSACGCAVGVYHVPSDRDYDPVASEPGYYAKALAEALGVSIVFARGVEFGFEGWLERDLPSINRWMWSVEAFQSGRITGIEIWRRSAEGYKP